MAESTAVRASRRAVLQALVAGVIGAPILASCSGSAEARHPALAAPRNTVLVTSVDVTSKSAALGVLEGADRFGGTSMVGLGASLFQRFGTSPPGLTVMPAFTGDVLEESRTGGDLLLQVESDDPDEARQHTRTWLSGITGTRIRWQVAGNRAQNTVRHDRPLMRNPFGYTEGHGNAPSASAQAVSDALVPRSDGQPAWMSGASLLAVRIIRLAHGLWDADDPHQQDRIIGRRPDGTWLDGRPSTNDPDFAQDPEGVVTPLDSHVRMVNPRTPGAERPRMVRRSWAYTADATAQGQPDSGILFMAYQADYRTGFERAQRRLQSSSTVEAMTPYVLAVGGGYFAVPARRPAEGWEKALFGAA